MQAAVARLAALVMIGLITTSAIAAPAWAHEEGETTEGYLLVQQALGHLAHDTSMSGIELAMEKVDDALETDDQDGVDVPELEKGEAALEAGDVDRARMLLEGSIQEALASLPAATGNQTGTHQITPKLEGRPDLRAQDWGLLFASVLALMVGIWLAAIFRPHDTVRTLRTQLASPPTARADQGEKGA